MCALSLIYLQQIQTSIERERERYSAFSKSYLATEGSQRSQEEAPPGIPEFGICAMEKEASRIIFPYVADHYPLSQSFCGDRGQRHTDSLPDFVLIVESRWPLSSVFT